MMNNNPIVLNKRKMQMSRTYILFMIMIMQTYLQYKKALCVSILGGAQDHDKYIANILLHGVTTYGILGFRGRIGF